MRRFKQGSYGPLLLFLLISISLLSSKFLFSFLG